MYLCKWFSSAPLSQVSVKACVFDLNQLMGVNTNQSLEAETESSCLLCSLMCVFSPSLYTYKYVRLGFVWLITFWGTEIWSSGSSWFPVHYSHWMNQSCRLSIFRGRVPVGGSLNPIVLHRVVPCLLSELVSCTWTMLEMVCRSLESKVEDARGEMCTCSIWI